MSDSESAAHAPGPHPTYGGKGLEALERPRYKSWRKKYRKMRHKFDQTYEENRQLFKDEQKLEAIAKRLKEELDGLLELCLDVNGSPNIPPELRFDVSFPRPERMPQVVKDNITPEAAQSMLRNYKAAAQDGTMPELDFHLIRIQIDDRLAAQGIESLDALEASVPHAIASTIEEVPEDARADEPLGYLTVDQENENIARSEAKRGEVLSLRKTTEEDKPWTELSFREQDRQIELTNPVSQHNWLKKHHKLPGLSADYADDNESLASHDKPERAEPKTTSRRRSNKNLAKRVGDRAVERAREGWSPSGVSGFEDDDIMDEPPVATSSGRKKKDPDGSYRAKVGKGGASKGKRKRNTEAGDTGSPLESAGSKKARLDAQDH